MSRRIARLLTCIAVAATLLVPAVASADDWDPIPELTPDEHAAVAQAIDGPNSDPLRVCLR